MIQHKLEGKECWRLVVGTTEASVRKYECLHSNSLIRAAERWKDNRKGAERREREKEEKTELLIVWVLRRNMSDVLLSMK